MLLVLLGRLPPVVPLVLLGRPPPVVLLVLFGMPPPVVLLVLLGRAPPVVLLVLLGRPPPAVPLVSRQSGAAFITLARNGSRRQRVMEDREKDMTAVSVEMGKLTCGGQLI